MGRPCRPVVIKPKRIDLNEGKSAAELVPRLAATSAIKAQGDLPEDEARTSSSASCASITPPASSTLRRCRPSWGRPAPGAVDLRRRRRLGRRRPIVRRLPSAIAGRRLRMMTINPSVPPQALRKRRGRRRLHVPNRATTAARHTEAPARRKPVEKPERPPATARTAPQAPSAAAPAAPAAETPAPTQEPAAVTATPPAAAPARPARHRPRKSRLGRKSRFSFFRFRCRLQSKRLPRLTPGRRFSVCDQACRRCRRAWCFLSVFLDRLFCVRIEEVAGGGRSNFAGVFGILGDGPSHLHQRAMRSASSTDGRRSW